MPYRVSTQVGVGTRKHNVHLAGEKRFIFGQTEGKWYIGLFWFAIVVLMYQLGWPWVYETTTGRSWRFRNEAATVQHPQSRVATTPSASVQTVVPPREFTTPTKTQTEVWECERHYALTLRQDPGGRCN